MQIQIRDLRNGDWYWIHKEVILRFGSKLGPYGIAIYNILALFAHGRTQECYPSQQRIAAILGCSRRTVFSYLKKLEKLKLVRSEKKDRQGRSYILLTSAPDSHPREGECANSDTPDVHQLPTNNNTLTRIYNNVNNDSKKTGTVLKKFRPKSKEELLAWDIAQALDDKENLGLYISYCRKYPGHIIWRAFGETKEFSADKIKKSRGALFTYLVKKYSHKNI